MTKEPLSKWPELLADLADHTSAILHELTSLDETLIERIARELIDRQRHNWGGQQVYFPKCNSLEVAERDLQMYADFNGTNHDELARKYDISTVQVYKRLRLVHEAEITKNQGDLFGDDD
ncbi:MAG: DNA-binding protein [Candidatus Thiodiazotropha sp. (ex Troendleina suluensis)]|nr:DNA-binding protein [Candidatus Thiodiazotropha sp. (ex Troendleina suluensis)]